MEDDTEVIKQQMAQTRESLAVKVEALENKVIGTVQNATDTVSSAVESVSETVASVQDRVSETVASVQDTVSGTVASVKEGVADTVDAVKGAFDISGHVQRHPWAMMGCSIAVGFVGALLVPPPRRERRDMHLPQWLGGRPEALPPPQIGTQPQPVRHEPGWFDEMIERFEPALDKLKELAIGATTGMVGEMILKNVPQHLHADVSSVIDQFTNAIGGKPTPHPAQSLSSPSAPPAPESSQPHNRLSKVKGNGRSI